MAKKTGVSLVAQNMEAAIAARRAERLAQAAANASASPAETAQSTVPAQDARPTSLMSGGPLPRPAGGMSGVASMIQQQEKSLRQQLEDAQRALSAAGKQKVDPNLIKPSRFYNRSELDYQPQADEQFQELMRSIQAGGTNAVEVLLNRHTDTGELETVYGHRRVAACRESQVQVSAYVLDDLDPHAIAQLQWIENSHRKDPSVIDRARQIASQLDTGAWQNQKHLAEGLNISPPQVSRLLEIARSLPPTLQLAHPNHHKITLRQAKELATIAVTKPDVFKTRLEVVARRRTELSAEAATAILLHGEASAANAAKSGARVTFASSTSGLTLKARNLSSAQTLELSKLIEAALQQLGLNESTEQRSGSADGVEGP